MRDFVSETDQRFAALAGAPAADAARRPRMAGGARRAVRPLAVLASVAAVTAILGSSPDLADRAEGLRVLAAPEASAAALAGRPGAPPPATYDYARSRQFATPDGRGYVLTSHRERSLCLVLPDGAAPGTYGSSCARISTVARRGSLGQMVLPARGDDPGRALTAFVLPAGAGTDVRVTSAGREVATSVTHGVVVVVTTAAATLQYDVQGQILVREIEAPFEETSDVTIACDDRIVHATIPPPPRGGSAPSRIDTARLCR